MNFFDSVTLFTSGLPVFLAFILAVLFSVLIYYYYRTTTPPISSKLRIFLITIRCIVIILIFFILIKPVLHITYTINRKSAVTFLLDASQSMQIKESGVSRGERALSVYRNLIQHKEVKTNADLHGISFAEDGQQIEHELLDSMKFTGLTTNIGDNLDKIAKRISKNNIKAVVLISDGAYNSGQNPQYAAQRLGIPIYSIGIGDTTPVQDLAIQSVLANKITYKNSKNTVKVSITSNGFKNKKINVYLKSKSKVIDKKNITVGGDLQEQIVLFDFVPKEEGMHRYTVQIPVYKNEKLKRNNVSSFYIKVLRDKIKILLVSGLPNYDYTFMKRSIDNEETILCTGLTAKIGQGFYQGLYPQSMSKLDTYDLIILLDVPAAYFSQQDIAHTIEFVADRGKSLWVLFGENSHKKIGLEKSDLRQLLPVSFDGRKMNITPEFQPSITPGGIGHPLMMLHKDPQENKELWAQIPPFLYIMKVSAVNKKALILATHPTEKISQNEFAPLFMFHAHKSGKVFCTFAYPLWRWKFMALTMDETLSSLYDTYINNVIRYLVIKEKNKLFKLTPEKRVYKEGEKIRFKAELYDHTYAPQNDGTIEVSVNNKEFQRKLTLQPSGIDGVYQGELTELPAGKYAYSSTALLHEKLLGKEKGSLFVDVHSLEFEKIEMRKDVLEKIAFVSNGEYYDVTNYQKIADKLTFEDDIQSVKKQIELWNNIYILISLILLLSTEWFIRKRKGML